jgi:hypothetical protein
MDVAEDDIRDRFGALSEQVRNLSDRATQKDRADDRREERLNALAPLPVQVDALTREMRQANRDSTAQIQQMRIDMTNQMREFRQELITSMERLSANVDAVTSRQDRNSQQSWTQTQGLTGLLMQALTTGIAVVVALRATGH